MTLIFAVVSGAILLGVYLLRGPKSAFAALVALATLYAGTATLITRTMPQ